MNLKEKLLYGRYTRLWLALALLIMLGLFLYIGRFNNPNGDDFLFAYVARTSSPLAVATDYFSTWTGRLSNIWLATFAYEGLGIEAVPKYAPAISLVLVTTTFYIGLDLVGKLLSMGGWGYQKVARLSLVEKVSYSAFFFFILLSSSVVAFDNFFWLPGVVTYLVPLSLISLAVVLLTGAFDGRRSLFYKCCAGLGGLLLTAAAGFMNEALNPQIIGTVFIGLITGLSLIAYKKSGLLGLVRSPIRSVGEGLKGLPERNIRALKRGVCSAFSLVLVLGVSSLVMYKAPGTAIRKVQVLGSSKLDQSLGDILVDGTSEGVANLQQFLGRSWAEIAIVLMVVVLFSGFSRLSKKDLKVLIGMVVYLVLFTVLLFFVNALLFRFAGYSRVTPYALLPSYFISIMSLLIAAISFGSYLRSGHSNQRGVRYELPALCLMIIFSATVYMRVLDRVKVQDVFTDSLRAEVTRQTLAGSRNAILAESHQVFSYCGIGTDPSTWCNDSMRLWYGIDSIKSKKLYIYDEEGVLKSIDRE